MLNEILFPVTSFVGAALICAAMYWFARRPLAYGQTFADRMELMYTFAAAGMVGNFFFETYPNALQQQMSIFWNGLMVLGIFVMTVIQKLSAQRGSSRAQDVTLVLDPERMEVLEYVQFEDATSDEAAERRQQFDREKAELRARKRHTLLLVGILGFLCMLEGIYLIYRGRVMLAFFLIQKLQETQIVCTSVLHALFGRRAYIIICVAWCVVVLCSTIPLIVGMPLMVALQIITHPATTVFYIAAAAVFYWFSNHYINIDKQDADTKETIIRLAVYLGGLVISWIGGFFT